MALENAVFVILPHALQPRLNLGRLPLTIPHGSVEPAFVEKFAMRAAFLDFAVTQHDDFVCIDHCGQPVGDHQRGTSFGNKVERGLDFLLGRRVERRRRLVENEDRWSFQDRPRNRHTLLFATRELQAAFADHRIVALRQRLDEVTDLGHFRGLLHFLIGSAGASVADVVGNRVVEQHSILRNHADRGAQALLRDVTHILPIDRDLAALHIVKAIEKP